MALRILALVLLILTASAAAAEDVRPGVLRTPELRFSNLTDFPFDSRYLEIDGMRLHYLDEGPPEGEVIFMIHGEPTWSYLFRKMIPILTAAGYRVITPDLIGFGKSDKFIDESAYSYAMQIDFMNQFVRELDLREITFFGQDWGGLIGLRVVADNPDRFARIIVSNTALASAPSPASKIGYPVFQATIWWLGPLSLDDLHQELTFTRWVAYSYHVDDMPIGDVMVALTGPEQARAGYEAPFPDKRYKAGPQIMPYLVPTQLAENEIAWETVLEKWNKPFLVAFTDQDPLTATGRDTFLERVPGAQSVPILGAGHFVQEDAGPELAQLIVEFIQERPLPKQIVVNQP